MNEQYLKSLADRPESERKRIATMGGHASVKARRRRKHGQELVRMMLQMDVTDAQVVAAMTKLGYDPAEIDNEFAMHARQIEKAQKTGDTKAYSAVMKAAGYDTTNVNVKGVAPIQAKDKRDAEEIRTMLDNIQGRKER